MNIPLERALMPFLIDAGPTSKNKPETEFPLEEEHSKSISRVTQLTPMLNTGFEIEATEPESVSEKQNDPHNEIFIGNSNI